MFQPKVGQKYWMINSRFQVKDTVNTGSGKAKGRIKVGNCFKTVDDAKQFAILIRGAASGKLVLQKRPWWKVW